MIIRIGFSSTTVHVLKNRTNLIIISLQIRTFVIQEVQENTSIKNTSISGNFDPIQEVILPLKFSLKIGLVTLEQY